jgi:hypothetical protein
MHLKIGDRVRLTEDMITDDFHRGEIYVSGTKDSIGVILSPDEFLLHEPYNEIYSHDKITKIMIQGEWYPVRYETIAPLKMIPLSGFEIVDHCRVGRVDLVPRRMMEKLPDNLLHRD